MSKIRVEGMSLVELRSLNEKLPAAIARAKAREADDLRKKLAELAASRGFSVKEVLEFVPKRKPANLKKMKDPKSGVVWSGRGRYPNGFDKTRAIAV